MHKILKTSLILASFLAFVACDETMSANDTATETIADKSVEEETETTTGTGTDVDSVVIVDSLDVIDSLPGTVDPDPVEPGPDPVEPGPDPVEPDPVTPSGDIFLCIDGKFNTDLIANNEVVTNFEVHEVSSGPAEPGNLNLEYQISRHFYFEVAPEIQYPEGDDMLYPDSINLQQTGAGIPVYYLNHYGYFLDSGDIMMSISNITVKAESGVEYMEIETGYGDVLTYEFCSADYPAAEIAEDGTIEFRRTID